MKRILGVLAVAALGVVLMAARPPSDLQLFSQLNGQPLRWRLFDGGSSGLYAAGVSTCFPFDGGVLTNKPFVPNVLLLVSENPVNICVRPQMGPDGIALPWDGGCSGARSDINFGVPLQAWVPQYVVVQPSATHVCSASDAGAHSVNAWGMQ